MESRKRLYKAGPRDNPTLTERVQKYKTSQQNARGTRFAAARQIPIESPSTPQRQQRVTKVSEIADKKEKLKAYRIEKNLKKFQEIQEQKSPFIVAVPVGRWVEKKERPRPVKMEFNNTPVKAALMNERVLKKSTVKNLIAQSTAKKENVMVFGAKKNDQPIKSKKKILGEFNSVESEAEPVDLNGTFDITPEKEAPEESPEPFRPPSRLRRSKSFADIVKLDGADGDENLAAEFAQKSQTPPAKLSTAVRRQATVVIKKPVIKKPVKREVAVKQEVPKKQEVSIKKEVLAKKESRVKKEAHVKQEAAERKEAPAAKEAAVVPPKKEAPVKRQISAPEASKKKPQPTKTAKSADVAEVPPQPEAKPAPKSAKKKPVEKSYVYSLYSSSLNTQVQFLTMELKNLTTGKDSFFELLSEDQQMSVEQAIQQGNLLIKEKLGKFSEFLENFEADQNNPDKPKRITEDDVENYWDLIYEDVNKLKSEFSKIQVIKANVLAAVKSAKKRRTRRTYLPDEGTPKRSKRIADSVDTPKHNASCYGCVTMSASKINTPKSAKRRTISKKSVAFDNVETPKRAENTRRSTKIHKPTPKRNLSRMEAIDVDDEDELNFA